MALIIFPTNLCPKIQESFITLNFVLLAFFRQLQLLSCASVMDMNQRLGLVQCFVIIRRGSTSLRVTLNDPLRAGYPRFMFLCSPAEVNFVTKLLFLFSFFEKNKSVKARVALETKAINLYPFNLRG